MTRLTLVTEIPAPYRIPLFNALAELVDLRVVFLAERNPLRPYRLHEDELRFRWEVLPNADFELGQRWLVLNRGIVRRLRGSDALLLGGWNQPAFWASLAYARATRTPALLWVESTLRDTATRAGRAKRVLAAAASGFVVPGRASAEYVRAIDSGARVVEAPNAVDGALFASRRGERDDLRRTLGLDGCVLLVVGRLAAEKGVDLLLRAAAGIDGVQVVVAGTGPEEARLRALAPDARFLGNVERDDLPRWYAAADVLVLPSRSEPWGMALNEGAAAGLPLVASDAAGAAWELVDDGVNGYRVPAGDVGALRERLVELAGDAELRAAQGAASVRIAARFTPAAWADAVAAAL